MMFRQELLAEEVGRFSFVEAIAPARERRADMPSAPRGADHARRLGLEREPVDLERTARSARAK
jgi:hypothetical protein